MIKVTTKLCARNPFTCSATRMIKKHRWTVNIADLYSRWACRNLWTFFPFIGVYSMKKLWNLWRKKIIKGSNQLAENKIQLNFNAQEINSMEQLKHLQDVRFLHESEAAIKMLFMASVYQLSAIKWQNFIKSRRNKKLVRHFIAHENVFFFSNCFSCLLSWVEKHLQTHISYNVLIKKK